MRHRRPQQTVAKATPSTLDTIAMITQHITCFVACTCHNAPQAATDIRAAKAAHAHHGAHEYEFRDKPHMAKPAQTCATHRDSHLRHNRRNPQNSLLLHRHLCTGVTIGTAAAQSPPLLRRTPSIPLYAFLFAFTALVAGIVAIVTDRVGAFALSRKMTRLPTLEAVLLATLHPTPVCGVPWFVALRALINSLALGIKGYLCFAQEVITEHTCYRLRRETIVQKHALSPLLPG